MGATYTFAKAKALLREGALPLVISLGVCMFRWLLSR